MMYSLSTSPITEDEIRNSIPLSSIHCAQSCDSEVILSVDGKDRRSKVAPQLNNLSSVIGKVFMVFESDDNKKKSGDEKKKKEKVYGGSAILLRNTACPSKSVILTCAHNFVWNLSAPDLPAEFIQCIKAQFHMGRDGEDASSSIEVFTIESFVIHPKYKECPSPKSGHDIALGFLASPPKKDYFYAAISTNSPKQGDQITVQGYPGELGFYQHLMTGTVDRIQKGEGGGDIIVYKDIDTTPGNSGAPIISELGAIIGVHTGGKKELGNYGTYINTTIKDWIQKQLNDQNKGTAEDPLVKGFDAMTLRPTSVHAMASRPTSVHPMKLRPRPT